MYLVLAEKPDVSKEIAGAILTGCTQKDGVYLGEDESGKTYAVTSAFGHLMELADPEDYDERYKQWRLEDLPIVFKDWRVVPAKEEYKKKRLRVIQKYLKECEAVVHAGDPDEEGQLLVDEILQHFKFEKTVYRVLLNDILPSNIRKEFENLKDNKEFLGGGRSAAARRMADKCFGINESRLACLKLRARELSIGRVQTPTLGLVVNRDEAIQNHVKEKYFELDINVEVPGYASVPFHGKPDKKYLETVGMSHIAEADFFNTLLKKLGKKVQVITEEKLEKVYPPMPYNLTILQSEMNKKYGYSMSETLDITQNLREKHHAISYNRSDSRYLKEEHYKEAQDVFRTILKGNLIHRFGLNFSLKSKCFDEANVTAHHAIIPLRHDVAIDGMSEKERNVYLAICTQYALQFLPPAQIKNSISTIILEDGIYVHKFIYNAKKTVDPGFLEYFNQTNKNVADVYIKSGSYTGERKSHQLQEKETRPLAKYTEGTLCLDMSNISKYVTDPDIKEILREKDKGKKGENGSIGTVATRGEIVKGLLKKGFLEEEGKFLISTQKGRTFFHLLPREIASPDLTAKWWLLQEKLKKGITDDINIIQESVVQEFLKHKDSETYNSTLLADEAGEPEYIGKCPLCGGNIEKRNGKYGPYFSCAKCNLLVNGSVCKHSVTKEEIINLLQGKEVFMRGMMGKKGKQFSAKIRLQIKENKGIFQMEFPNR